MSIKSSCLRSYSLMDHCQVSLFLYLLFLCCSVWLCTNYSEKLATFGAHIDYLSLEWDFAKFGNVNVGSLELLQTPKLIFKGNSRVFCSICKILFKQSLILFHRTLLLITKLHSFMQHYSYIYIQTYNLVFQNISKILRKLLRIYNFHVSIS